MDLLDKLLVDVKKDARGYDDLEDFWRATEKLSLPLSERMRNQILRSAFARLEGNRFQTSDQTNESSMQEDELTFTYDSSSTISGYESSNELDDDGELEHSKELSSMAQKETEEGNRARNGTSIESSLRSISLSPLQRSAEASQRLSPVQAETSIALSASELIHQERSEQQITAAGLESSFLSVDQPQRDHSESALAVESIVSDHSISLSMAAGSLESSAISLGRPPFDSSSVYERQSKSNLVTEHTLSTASINLSADAQEPGARPSLLPSSPTLPFANSSILRDVQGDTPGPYALQASVEQGGKSARSANRRRVSFPTLSPIEPDPTDRTQISALTSAKSGRLTRSSGKLTSSMMLDDSGLIVPDRRRSTDSSSTAPQRPHRQQSLIASTAKASSVSSKRSRKSESSSIAVHEAENYDDGGGEVDGEVQVSASDDLETNSALKSIVGKKSDRNKSFSVIKSTETMDVAVESTDESSTATDEQPPELSTPMSLTTKRAQTSSAVATPKDRRRRSYISAKTHISTPASNEYIRGMLPSDTTFAEDEDEETDKDDQTKGNMSSVSTSFIDQSYLDKLNSSGNKKIRKQLKQSIQSASKKPRRRSSLDQLLEDDKMYKGGLTMPSDDEEEEQESHVRRSKRATKSIKLQHWKGERPQYQQGSLVGIMKANLTPKKPQAKRKRKLDVADNRKGKKKKKAKKHEDNSRVEVNTSIDLENTLPDVKLPDDYDYINAEEHEYLHVWDSYVEMPQQQLVVRCRTSLPEPTKLPVRNKRNKPGTFTHIFNVPEVKGQMSAWISGCLDLPPRAVKEAEGVGKYAQVFYLVASQPKALEFAMADPNEVDWDDARAQRLILSPGDSFFVPPGNVYRLENHSEAATCRIYWVIIKPIEEPDGVVGSSVSNATVASGK